MRNLKCEIVGQERKRHFKLLIADFKLSVLAVSFLLSSCVGIPLRQETSPPVAGADQIVANARHYLNTRPDWDIDCSNFVRACVKSEAMDSYLAAQGGKNLTLSIFGYLRRYGVERKDPSAIRPGDVLIFHYTYDANRDGSIDAQDVYTHSGIAESMKDGLLTYIDSSKGRKDPKIRRRSFSFREGGKNERVATDPKTGREIRHRETYAASFGHPVD